MVNRTTMSDAENKKQECEADLDFVIYIQDYAYLDIFWGLVFFKNSARDLILKVSK